MATLYQYHGKIDLIIADPPYNTGKDFRYNDKWEEKSVEKIDKNGWTLWKRRTNDGDLSIIYRENLKEIVEIMLRT